MKTIPVLHITKITCLALAAIGFIAVSAHAQTILGSFQGSSDPLNAGWIDPNNSDPITSDPTASFVAAGVSGYPLSLDMSAAGHAGSFGYPSLELQFSPAQIAAFNANSYITFTISVASGAATSGYFQIYNLVLNAPGYGYHNVGDGGNAAATWGTYSQATGFTGNNQNGEPNFYFYSGDPTLQSETVTFNYSSFLPAIVAGGESFLQMTFQGNQGGGAPTDMYFNNVELSTTPFAVPEPTTGALVLAGGAIALLLARRRTAK
jgi:hypothetical protein